MHDAIPDLTPIFETLRDPERAARLQAACGLSVDELARLDFQPWHSGGGCWALAATTPGADGPLELLLTDVEGVDLPVDEHNFLLGVYAEGDFGDPLGMWGSDEPARSAP